MTASHLRLAAVALTAVVASLLPAPALAEYGEDAVLEERDPDYAAGKLALARKDWESAARRFATAALREPDNADVHNLLGFSNRNLGRYDLAFKHYQRALMLDPRHKGAHEYIGETYLKVGDLASAEKHLEALKNLCPMSCEQLKDLEREIAEFRKNK